MESRLLLEVWQNCNKWPKFTKFLFPPVCPPSSTWQHISSTGRLMMNFNNALFCVKHWSVINQNCHYMQWLAFCAAMCPILSVLHLAQRYFWNGFSVDCKQDRFWGYSYSLWRMLCDYSLEGCDVVNVCRKADHSSECKWCLNFRGAGNFWVIFRSKDFWKHSGRHKPQGSVVCVYLLKNFETFKENHSISSCVVHVMNTKWNNQHIHEKIISIKQGYL